MDLAWSPPHHHGFGARSPTWVSNVQWLPGGAGERGEGREVVLWGDQQALAAPPLSRVVAPCVG
jgi:hypothetical protein